MTELTNAVDQAKPEPLDLNEIRVWAHYAKRANKEMGMAPDCAIALLDRLQQAERDRDHYYLAAEIEAREVDRQKGIAVAAVAKLLPALSACLKAMHHAAPFFKRGVEATLLADAIKAAQEALSDGVDPEPADAAPFPPHWHALLEWNRRQLDPPIKIGREYDVAKACAAPTLSGCPHCRQWERDGRPANSLNDPGQHHCVAPARPIEPATAQSNGAKA